MSLNILIVPGYHGSGDAHWQTWLEKQLPNAHRLSGIDWEQPVIHRWADAIVRELDSSSRKTIIVAHSFGCLASSVALAQRPEAVAGVILVAPADPERFALEGARRDHLASQPSVATELPDGPLGKQGLVIASSNDPWMKLQHAYAWSKRWQLAFCNVGEAGHINHESGYGPWPLIQIFTETLSDLVAADTPTWGKAAIQGPARRLVTLQTYTANSQHRLYA